MEVSLRDLREMFGDRGSESGYTKLVGGNVFIRCVTHYFTGRLVRAYPDALVLTDAAWIADCGRYAGFLATGAAQEVEPYPAGLEVMVGTGSIVDISSWPHALPREQK